MKEYRIALDDLNQTYILDAVGSDWESINNFAANFSSLLKPLLRTKLEIYTDLKAFGEFSGYMKGLLLEAQDGENPPEYMSSIDQFKDDLVLIQPQSYDNYEYYLWNEGKSTTTTTSAIMHLANEKRLDTTLDCQLLVPVELHPYPSQDRLQVVVDKSGAIGEASISQIGYLASPSSAKVWVRGFFPLKYHFSKKHGDKDKTAQAGNKGDSVSQFWGDELSANELFANSVWDFRESRKWYNYDSDKGLLIIFHSEGDTPQNLFHCYHFTLEDAATQKQRMPDHLLKELRADFGF